MAGATQTDWRRPGRPRKAGTGLAGGVWWCGNSFYPGAIPRYYLLFSPHLSPTTASHLYIEISFIDNNNQVRFISALCDDSAMNNRLGLDIRTD